jgi:hypothetical protein
MPINDLHSLLATAHTEDLLRQARRHQLAGARTGSREISLRRRDRREKRHRYLIGFENRLLVLIRWVFSFLAHGRGARLITAEAQAPNILDGVSPVPARAGQQEARRHSQGAAVHAQRCPSRNSCTREQESAGLGNATAR